MDVTKTQGHIQIAVFADHRILEVVADVQAVLLLPATLNQHLVGVVDLH